jgi:hypothetical protein
MKIVFYQNAFMCVCVFVGEDLNKEGNDLDSILISETLL